jgi:hypothetical protein
MTDVPASTPTRPPELRLREELARLLADRVRDAEDEAVGNLPVDLDLTEIDRDLDERRSLEAVLGRLRAGRYGGMHRWPRSDPRRAARGATGGRTLRALPAAARTPVRLPGDAEPLGHARRAVPPSAR